ncbi:MAG TPA: hypothetical protein VM186_07260 [Planctomycetota bacterium]|nr:hypothetical protein [Planctomycetota bacterium]
MNDAVQERLRQFTELLLTQAGGAVEWPAGSDEGLSVLPPGAAFALYCPETVNLSCRPDSGGAAPASVPEAGLCANLATDFLERVAPLLEMQPRIGVFRIPELYLKQGSMAEAVARAFTWLNAKVVVGDARPVDVEYHTWYLHGSILSEERWEEVIRVTVNSASGSAVAFPDPVTALDLVEADERKPRAAGSYHAAAAEATRLMQGRASAFVARLESRLERDRKRVRDYYSALLREDKTRKRHRQQPDEEQERSKRRAVELELGRKLAELDERFAITAELRPLVLVRITAQVLAVRCEVYRKQARKARTVYWNPLLKELEPIRCSVCGSSTFSAAFTNEGVDPLCPACAS